LAPTYGKRPDGREAQGEGQQNIFGFMGREGVKVRALFGDTLKVGARSKMKVGEVEHKV